MIKFCSKLIFGTSIAFKREMKVLTLTVDRELIQLVDAFASEYEHHSFIYNKSRRPIDIVGFTYEKNPSLIIVDDDYVNPDAAVMISTLKKIKKNIEIIFITSNSSIELGKQISPLGITYYAIKPLDKEDFDELLNSVSKKRKTNLLTQTKKE